MDTLPNELLLVVGEHLQGYENLQTFRALCCVSKTWLGICRRVRTAQIGEWLNTSRTDRREQRARVQRLRRLAATTPPGAIYLYMPGDLTNGMVAGGRLEGEWLIGCGDCWWTMTFEGGHRRGVAEGIPLDGNYTLLHLELGEREYTVADLRRARSCVLPELAMGCMELRGEWFLVPSLDAPRFRMFVNWAAGRLWRGLYVQVDANDPGPRWYLYEALDTGLTVHVGGGYHDGVAQRYQSCMNALVAHRRDTLRTMCPNSQATAALRAGMRLYSANR